MKKENIALQVYSVRGDLEKNFFGTLRAVKEMGYAGVEFAGLYGNDPLQVKAFCEEIGLKALSAHVAFPEFMADLDGTVNTYATLGVPYIAIPWLNEERRPGHPGYPEFLEGMKAISTKLKEKGITLSYHNHDFEFEKLDGKYLLDIMYEDLTPEQLQTQLDTCWVNVGGENPADYIKKYAGRIPTVHLKDFRGSKSENMYGLIGVEGSEAKADDNKFMLTPVGKGRQDFPAIVAAADEGGAKWYIVEQDEPSLGLTPLECAKASIEYLHNEICK